MSADVINADEIETFLQTLQQKSNHMSMIWLTMLFSGTSLILVSLISITFLSASSTQFLDVNQPAIYALAIFAILTAFVMVLSSAGSRWSDASYVRKGLAEIRDLRKSGHLNNRESLHRVVQLSTYLGGKRYFLGPLNIKEKAENNDACLCGSVEIQDT